MDFKGKVALITGAGNGIGRAAAIGFASRGARVVIVDHAKDAGEATAGILRQQGGEPISSPPMSHAPPRSRITSKLRWTPMAPSTAFTITRGSRAPSHQRPNMMRTCSIASWR